MDQDTERKLLKETIIKLNEYVRFLVRNKKRKQAESFCDEKYVQIATTGFLKRILADFIDKDEENEGCLKADLENVFEFINEKLRGKAKIVKSSLEHGSARNSIIEDNIEIDAGEGVSLNLFVKKRNLLAVKVCVPSPKWYTPPQTEEKTSQADIDTRMPEPDGKEEKEPLIFPLSRLGAFCKAAEHIFINAHHLNEWPKLSCWRLPEKYKYLDYPKKDVYEKVPDIWWDDWLEEASEEDRSDMDFVKKLISKRGECLKYASNELKSDRKIVIKAVKNNSYAINYASEEIQNDREFILENIKKNDKLFEDIKEKYRDDKEIALIAVKKRSSNYEHLSERLKKDRDIIETVMADNVFFLCDAPCEVLKDKELAMRIVSERGDMLKYMPECMRADKDIVMTAVTTRGACASEEYGTYGIMLGYASDDLKNDRDVVLAAVRFAGFALKCASDELKDDREIVRTAIDNYGRALDCASERLKDDRELVIEAVKRDGTAFCFASERLRTDKEIITAAVQSAGIEVFHAFPENLIGDLDFKIFMLEAIVHSLPKFEDYGEFGDGTSEYYDIFEDYEETFCNIVEDIPIDQLKVKPELMEKICSLAVLVDRAYYDEGSNPYEDLHDRLPYTLKDYFEENNIPYSSIITKEIEALETKIYHPKNCYDDLPLAERLFNETADWYDWWAEKIVTEDGFEAHRKYFEPDGGYVNGCMEKFVKEIIKNWEGRYHYDELWEDDEYEVNLDSVYEEISRRLSSKMKVVRAASEYYYSENVNVTVNAKVYLKLVRDCPQKILELWVNNYNSDLERGFWIAPDRLNVFCDMAEYIQDNYDKFALKAKERAKNFKNNEETEVKRNE